jgi:hypothetical protein
VYSTKPAAVVAVALLVASTVAEAVRVGSAVASLVGDPLAVTVLVVVLVRVAFVVVGSGAVGDASGLTLSVGAPVGVPGTIEGVRTATSDIDGVAKLPFW